MQESKLRKECPIRYITKALVWIAKPSVAFKEGFIYCTNKCKWYEKGKCLYVENRRRQ